MVFSINSCYSLIEKGLVRRTWIVVLKKVHHLHQLLHGILGPLGVVDHAANVGIEHCPHQ
jgi:hypothetical protein